MHDIKTIKTNLHKLESWFADCRRGVVAFSGGVDSCLVAFLARKFLGKDNSLAVISASPSLKQRDLNLAQEFCERFDISLEIIHTREIENPDYYSNPVNRCYFCKHTLYEELQEIAEKYPGCRVLNGQNLDDLGDYRPGLKAAREFRVYQPLSECGLNKYDVRDLAHYFALPTWDKPASPCLSSRIPYGQQVSLEKLRRIESAENLLNTHGFDNVRVRHLENTARIEVPSERVAEVKREFERILPEILALGFAQCEIDEEGLVSGKLNRAIS